MLVERLTEFDPYGPSHDGSSMVPSSIRVYSSDAPWHHHLVGDGYDWIHGLLKVLIVT